LFSKYLIIFKLEFFCRKYRKNIVENVREIHEILPGNEGKVI